MQIAACIVVGLAAFSAGRFARPETGLRGHYYTNLTRTGPPVATAIDRAVSSEGLTRGTAAAWTAYSVEWTGAIVIGRAGEYVFATVSDDGSEMDVAEQTVVRNGGLHGPQEASGRIALAAGVHPIRVRYEQAGGGLHLEVKYGFGDAAPAPIPDGILLPEPMSYVEFRARNAVPVLAAGFAMLLFVASQRRPLRPGNPGAAAFGVFDRPAVAIAVIAIVAVTLRILMMLGSNGILWADSDVFLDTFGAIRNGRWFEHDPFRTLLYPYFLTPFLLWSTEKPMDQVIVGAQHLLGVITAITFFFVGRAAFSTRIALAGALVFSAHTTQLFYENSILTEALFGCLLAFSLVLMIRFLRTPTLLRAVAVGLACLVLTLTRPAAQGFIAVPAVLALMLAADWRRRVTYAALMTSIYVVALLPWMSLNQRMFGFHGVALGQGLGLFIRTSQIERYEPSMYRAYPEIEELLTFARTTQSATGHVVDGLRRRGLSSARTDALLYRASLSAIAQRPFEFGVHSLRQWWRQLGSLDDEDICTGPEGAYICSDRTIGYAREPFLNRPRSADQPVRPLVVAYFRHFRIPMHVVTVLAAFGAMASLRSAPALLLVRLFLILTVVYFTLLPAITQSLQDRFRLPVDAVLFVLAAFGLAELARIVLRRGPLDPGSSPSA